MSLSRLSLITLILGFSPTFGSPLYLSIHSHSKFPSLDQPSRLNLRSVNGLSSGNGAGTTTDQQGNEGNTLTPTDGNAGNQSAVGGTGGSNPNNASVQNGGNEDGAGQTGHRGNKQKWEDPAQVGQIIADGVRLQ